MTPSNVAKGAYSQYLSPLEGQKTIRLCHFYIGRVDNVAHLILTHLDFQGTELPILYYPLLFAIGVTDYNGTTTSVMAAAKFCSHSQ